MTETRPKVLKPRWSDRLPLIERAVNEAKPSQVGYPADQSTPSNAGPAARSRVQDSISGHPAPIAAPAPQPIGSPRPRSRLKAEIDLKRLEDMGMITPDSVRNRLKEEFRVIKRGVLKQAFHEGSRSDLPGNLIMVASARPGEGKTFTSINLAMSIAIERDYTVLLVDGDFSRPSIMKTLGLETGKGMIDVLGDPTLDLSDVMMRTNIDKVSLLPAGTVHGQSTELLSSQRMKSMIMEISKRYHDRVVIFDSPPILATSEPSALAMHVGQIIMVVNAGRTPRSAVKEALGLIDTGAHIGLLLNRCSPRVGQTQFGSYYYGYGTGSK